MAIVADRRLWLTADRQGVVEEGDPRAAFLLAAPGRRVPASEVERLGIRDEDGDVILPEYEPAEEPAEEEEGDDGPAGEEEESGATVQFGSGGTPLGNDFPANQLLSGAGLRTVEAVAEATDDELLAIDGIGPARLEDIRQAIE